MTLTLIDRNPDLCAAWRTAFQQHEAVSVVEGSFQDAMPDHDTFVTAGNSFGLMDGGIDQAVWDFFGPDTQDRVQAAIRREWAGFLPIGAAVAVPMPRGKALIYPPTMVFPGDVRSTAHAYLGMLAALKVAERSGAQRILCCGLATGVGRMAPSIAAAQMELAYAHTRNPPVLNAWPLAKAHVDAFVSAGR